MFPEESAQGGVDLQAKAVHPIHWGTFKLVNHAWDDPVKRIVAKATQLSLPLSIPKHGEMVTFPIPSAHQEVVSRGVEVSQQSVSLGYSFV